MIRITRGEKWKAREAERARRYEERMRDRYRVTTCIAIMGKTVIRPAFTIDEGL